MVLLAVYPLLGAPFVCRLTYSRLVPQFVLRRALLLIATNLLDMGIMAALASGLVVAVVFRFGLLLGAVMVYGCF